MSRIIDLGFLAGAYATRLLMESGHDVIRIDPSKGDAVRRTGPYLGETPAIEGGAFHHFLNAGKRSFSVNLDSSAGWQLFLELLETADAVITSENLPGDKVEKVQKTHELIWTEIQEENTELCAYAKSGLLSSTGQPESPPTVLGGHIIYLATGIYVAVATATALYVREETGQGQFVRVSMKDCLETFAEQAMVEYTFSGTKTERRGARGTITAISGALPCKDGYWVVSQINRPGRWEKFMDWVRDPELMADVSLGSDDTQRIKKDFVMDRILAWSKQRTKSELVEEGQKRHFPCSPVSSPLDLVEDPQLIARGFLREIDHPDFGRLMFPQGAIARLRGQRVGRAPSLGQHNAEILAELGYSDADLQTLIEIGAV